MELTLSNSGTAPTASAKPEPIDLTRTALRSRYKNFSDEHFEEFLAKCRLRGLEPAANQVYGILHFDRHVDALVVELLVGIEGMRLIAHRTQQYAGCDAAEFTFNADAKPNAKVRVYRMVGGLRHPFTGEATWDEYAPPPDVDEVWDSKPQTCISKVAEAAALRKAFPQELGALYAPEEWTKAQEIDRRAPERPAKPDPDSQVDPRVEDYSQV